MFHWIAFFPTSVNLSSLQKITPCSAFNVEKRPTIWDSTMKMSKCRWIKKLSDFNSHFLSTNMRQKYLFRRFAHILHIEYWIRYTHRKTPKVIFPESSQFDHRIRSLNFFTLLWAFVSTTSYCILQNIEPEFVAYDNESLRKWK